MPSASASASACGRGRHRFRVVKRKFHSFDQATRDIVTRTGRPPSLSPGPPPVNVGDSSASIHALRTARIASSMSARRPPRRTARKRTRAEAISDEEPADTIPSTPTASETFGAALTQLTHTQSSLTRQTRRTRSRLEEDPDSSARSIISNEASSSTNNGPPLITNDEQSTKPKAARIPKKKVTSSTLALDTPHPTPTRWREAYDAIKEMRKRVLAPVDGMGCGNAGDVEQDPKVRVSSRSLSYRLAVAQFSTFMLLSSVVPPPLWPFTERTTEHSHQSHALLSNEG